MIIGVGIDLIEVERVLRACERRHFLERIFTEAEISQADKKRERLASDFAVKEAVTKAMGTGFRAMAPHDIECLRDEATGAPFVRLSDRARKQADELGISSIHVSISDTAGFTTAVAICEN